MTAAPGPKRELRWLQASAALVLVVAVWVRPEQPIFFGTDAAVYARISRELSQKPVSQWADLRLGQEPFYEHPPLALWGEALTFRALGASATSAMIWARLVATLLALLVFATARRLADERAGAWAAAALVLLPAFLFEAQNAMFELPMAACCALALYGGARAIRGARGGLLFALGLTLAFWVKGPPALALLAPLAWWGWRRQLPWRRCALLAGASVLAVVATAAGFEAWRRALGLEPFFAHYLSDQVWASLSAGRHHPSGNWLYYARPLAGWYLPALLLLPLLYFPAVRASVAAVTGLVFWAAVVAGFTLARQKYDWYLHLSLPGVALYSGAALVQVLRPAWERWLTRLMIAGAGIWVALVVSIPSKIATHHPELERIAELPPPTFAPGAAHAVANCTKVSAWRATHMFAYYWDADAVSCEASASFAFDGERLTAR